MNPDSYTINERMIKTADGLHSLYVQEWGNPSGTPIIFLHGGPGVGCDDGHKEPFDPKKHRVIFLDQRGSGKSTPHASLENNTTQDLVEDLELIRNTLAIDSWVITGGSWGSTLALCYGIKYGNHVQSMVLRGIFLGNQEELDWFYGGGNKDFFPEIWERLLARTPPEHHEAPHIYHFEQISNPASGEAYKKSTYALYAIDMALMKLDTRLTEVPYEEFDAESAKVNLSYFTDNKHCYLPQNYILDNVSSLTMPITIIQGRYDMVCRPLIAHKLHQSLPNSSLIMTVAGHSGSERNTFDATKAVLSTL